MSEVIRLHSARNANGGRSERCVGFSSGDDWIRMHSTYEVATEIADCLFSTALLTRALNRLLANKAVERLDTRVLFAGNNAIVTHAVVKGLVDSKLDEETIAAIRVLLNAIEDGKARIEDFRHRRGGGEAADRAALAALADHWRRVCALGVLVQVNLRRTLGTSARPHRFDRLIRLLTDAGLGGDACCGAENGTL